MKQIFSVLLLLMLVLHANSQDLSLGLRAYYPFNGNANDASGNNNNPSINTATLTTDRFGSPNSAYNFNGTSSYIRIPVSSTVNIAGPQISLCALVNVKGFYQGTCHGNALINKGDDDFLAGNYLLRFDDNAYTNGNNCSTPIIDPLHQAFYAGSSGGAAHVPAAGPYIQLNQWVSVVYTYDGTVGRIYLNCNLIETRTGANGSNTNTYDLFLGRLNNAQYPYWFNGDMDEVRIYNRALTQAEINIYGGCAAAPVTLTNFTASVINKKSIRLNWETENETDMKEYAIQRSVANENNFTTIAMQAPANKLTKNSYTHTDNTALPNTLYQYRLEMGNMDGSKKYSAIKTAKIDNKDFFITLLQNPVKDLIQLRTGNYTGDAAVSFYNAAGMLVKQAEIRLINNQVSSLNAGGLAKGFYWMHVQAGNTKIAEKVFIAD